MKQLTLGICIGLAVVVYSVAIYRRGFDDGRFDNIKNCVVIRFDELGRVESITNGTFYRLEIPKIVIQK